MLPMLPLHLEPIPAVIPLEGRVISNIRPHFQPIVTSIGHDLYAYEALLRIPGLATSDALFRRWESTGEVAVIDATMVRRVRAAIMSSGRKIAVTVNASALTVAVSPTTYLNEIEALARVARQVIVEVTETFPVLKFSELLAFSARCKQLGVQFALDDCTPNHEFCNLDALKQLQPDILKIDGGLITESHRTGDARPVRAVVELAAAIGASVVAEHVASASLRDWAVGQGVDLLQGFYFSNAKPLADHPDPLR